MKSVVKIILSLAIISAATAFFRPAQPHQVPAVIHAARGGETMFDYNFALVDEGLDNPTVASDENIEAARKCGFCMGWAGQTNCPVSGL